ncbi:MAG: ABC transporter ATP-binding protein [Bacillota bacterium]|uniref:ABC transporter ATP-binding protein n=1 Tax=Virgibacillus salarius TaxID=447199 RepID=A0A941I9Q4_9BACI|nr:MULTISPECIES: ABC transporter ATP-binding protein [Bacillaceae]NAZ07288.1 ATP-binding cassette domain-containing protein [Agaribacter marinus]MBR7794566.1 ABC transporter ATP-binding protein [Virgibacillus salarius]MCC2249445.1 ABC transporter ATP-binding protein [Virgibacillus sp. AGTR]MDY7043357.1 ABC transporter ATP-binding protein [Virgibacillus sp. M23]QRZ17813.1 ABC transporter ATP-binding protein [Virgibacillus sp. AGTR]
MQTLTANDLTLGYGDNIIIDDLSLEIPKGEITVFIGGNGCGKSTLLRSLARLLKPKQGNVVLDGAAIAKMGTKDVAKKLAILPQSPISPEGLTVHELVKQGRHPYRGLLKQWSDEDEKAVNHALDSTNMFDLKDRPVDSLSGGQRQRAWIAMTLAQDTDIILLDEPTTYLDMTHQIEVLDLLFELNEKEGRTVVMVLHDLNLACRYAHHIVAIKDKQIFAQGKPEEIITCNLVHQVFEMMCDVTFDPRFGTPMCIPHGKGRCIFANATNAIN